MAPALNAVLSYFTGQWQWSIINPTQSLCKETRSELCIASYSYFIARVASWSERLGVMSAAVDGRMTRRIEVDEVDEQLTTLSTDETRPVPGHFLAAVPSTYRQLSVSNTLRALTHTHTHTIMSSTWFFVVAFIYAYISDFNFLRKYSIIWTRHVTL